MYPSARPGDGLAPAVDAVRRGRLHRAIVRRQELRLRHGVPEPRGNGGGGAGATCSSSRAVQSCGDSTFQYVVRAVVRVVL